MASPQICSLGGESAIATQSSFRAAAIDEFSGHTHDEDEIVSEQTRRDGTWIEMQSVC